MNSNVKSEKVTSFLNCCNNERVNLFKVIEKMNLVNLTPDIDVKGIWIHVPEFNRPALQLTGFYGI